MAWTTPRHQHVAASSWVEGESIGVHTAKLRNRPLSANRQFMLPKLDTLEETQRQLLVDKERAVASIAITRSGMRMISAEHRLNRRTLVSPSSAPQHMLEDRHLDLAQTWPCGSVLRDSSCFRDGASSDAIVNVETDNIRALTTRRTLTLAEACPGKIDLRDAFDDFDINGDGCISVGEAITHLNKCHLFDKHFLTEAKVRIYLKTLLENCNEFTADDDLAANGIGFRQFETLLQWVSVMKGLAYSECVSFVLRRAKESCGSDQSLRRKLKVIFVTCGCKSADGIMTPYEFSCICRRWHVFETGKFDTGDVFKLFIEEGGVVDFDGFVRLLYRAGERLDQGRQLLKRLASVADGLEATEVQQRHPKIDKIARGLPWEKSTSPTTWVQ